MTRLVLSLAFFLLLSIGVGVLMAGDDEYFDWVMAAGLFALALAGEGLRLWLRRSRAKNRESAGV